MKPNTLRFVSRVGHHGMKACAAWTRRETNGDVVNGSNAWKAVHFHSVPCDVSLSYTPRAFNWAIVSNK
jgi:hypothetical protein